MAANQKNTTLKAVMLSYRDVDGDGTYTELSGVLRGLTITQDEPESTSIDAEFFDSPFYIEYTGNPVTINFEWANYSLGELEALIGGKKTNGTAPQSVDGVGTAESYSAPTAITSVEKEWKLDFGVGYKSLILYRGSFVATLKKDEDGALNYACTITSLINEHTVTTGSGDNAVTTTNKRIYSIVGDAPEYSAQ